MKIILEMANNHQGSLVHGKRIIEAFANVVQQRWPQFEFIMKFQRRTLKNIIHPTYANDGNFPYLQKFQYSQLSLRQLGLLKQHAEQFGFNTLCTPFDEESVDDIVTLGFDAIKIGSCSSMDWPLLHKIAETKLPVILSTGGVYHEELYRMVPFFTNRGIPLTLMHCVGLYPTASTDMCLDMIDEWRKNFPHVEIGLSSHEEPDNYLVGALAAAKDVEIFERHIDIDHDGINAYSITPQQCDAWLANIWEAHLSCSAANFVDVRQAEHNKLNTFRRAAFLKRDVKKGEKFTRDDVYFAMPRLSNDHLTGGSFSKYNTFVAKDDLQQHSAIECKDVDITHNRPRIQTIHDMVMKQLKEANVSFNGPQEMEISHHYGFENFDEIGMCIITLINEEYCKKVLVVRPGQTNPDHYHKSKKETFFVVDGEAIFNINGDEHILSKGQMITVNPQDRHMIASKTGAVIEEISTNHQPNDSFYLDENINNNPHRKTVIYV